MGSLEGRLPLGGIWSRVAFGSFRLRNHQARVTGLEQGEVDQNTAPFLEAVAAFTVVGSGTSL